MWVLFLGMFADLLVVRLCLASAYCFLVTNCLTGSPLWPALYRPDHLTVDMLIWGIVCLYVHISSVVRLLQDERHVTLSDEEEALWRMFYRVGGLSRKLFQYQILPHMAVVHVPKGTEVKVEEYFHIVYQGAVSIHIYQDDQLLTATQDGSGALFDLKKLGLMQYHTPMAKHRLQVTTICECTLFQFSNSDIRHIANAKNTKSVWQSIFIGVLARIAVRRLPPNDSGNPHDDYPHPPPKQASFYLEANYIDPLFAPLSKAEEPNPLLAGSGQALEQPLQHVWYCMQRFFTPPWPFSQHAVGIRHTMLPAPVPTEGSTETLEVGINSVNDSKKTSTFSSTANDDNETAALLPNKGGEGGNYKSVV